MNNTVLINACVLRNLDTGVEQSLLGLLEGMIENDPHDFGIELICRKGYNALPPAPHPFLIQEACPSSRMRKACWENVVLPEWLRKKGRERDQLYHSPTYVLPRRISGPCIVTCHDLIALDHPRLCHPRTRNYYRLNLPYALHRADRIASVSTTVKGDILKRYPDLESKIEVIPHGISPSFQKIGDPQLLEQARLRFSLPDAFILFTGKLERKKNIPKLLSAFAQLKKQTDLPHKLVLVGTKGWKFGEIEKTVRQLQLEKEVIFTGYIPAEYLPAVYNLADLFVFPSLYEGFGLPPLEAMACGTPTITSGRGALAETTGGCSHEVDPDKREAFAAAMFNMLHDNDMRQHYKDIASHWVRKFTWRESAARYLQLYRTLLKTSTKHS